jgi:alpha-glucosidase
LSSIPDIPILDAAIAKQCNSTDLYDPYLKGDALDIFLRNPDGTQHIGQVWPGYTVFPDWLASGVEEWWTEGLRNWSRNGVEWDGIWLDMNEAASFCEGSW